MLAIPALLVLLSGAESADSIMAKVAANQDKAQAARSKYVYRQDVYVRLLQTNNQIAREERRVYTVAPTPDGFKKDMVAFSGKYSRDGKLYDYSEPGFKHKDLDVDGDLAEDLADDLVNDKGSKDGISMDLFPLTGDKQADYRFKLVESKEMKGRMVHRIRFEPKDKEDFGWAGEVLVDAAEYQPLSVTTKLSRSLPWGVKVFLGTNLKQLGFSVAYVEVAEGVWFPATYGTEFRVDVLFGYKRIITMSLTNSDFRRTNVESTIEYEPKTKH